MCGRLQKGCNKTVLFYLNYFSFIAVVWSALGLALIT